MKIIRGFRLKAGDGSIGDWAFIDVESTFGFYLSLKLKNGASYVYTNQDGPLYIWCNQREFKLDCIDFEFNPEKLTLTQVKKS